MTVDSGSVIVGPVSYREMSLHPHKKLMKRLCETPALRGNLATILFVLLLLPLRFALADSGIEKQLNSDYKEKVLTLRHFYTGEGLKFRSDGKLNGDAPIGPWTLDGQIEVQRVHLRDGLLVIDARRIHRVFDSQLKPQDQLIVFANKHDKAHKDKYLEKMLRGLKVEIEIELPSEKPDPKDVSSAIRAVFLTDSESMMDIVPSFWRAYFAKQEGKPQPAPSANGPLYHVKPGEVSAPHLTYQPDPDYSEEARRAKFQGTVLISLIADASGAPRDVQVTKPLGLGLDEKAVATVSTWKFEPAQKDGQPVPVQLMVEVSFRLY